MAWRSAAFRVGLNAGWPSPYTAITRLSLGKEFGPRASVYTGSMYSTLLSSGMVSRLPSTTMELPRSRVNALAIWLSDSMSFWTCAGDATDCPAGKSRSVNCP